MEVLDEVAEWQNRPLDICYPLVFFDAIRVKVRDEGFVRNKAIYIALGVLPDGTKEILGIWIEQTEGAKFWLRVVNELKTRGAQDILIAVVDGLKGFPEAINAVFPADRRSNLRRPPDPPFDGFCLLEGSQERRAGACVRSIAPPMRSRPGGPRRLRARSVGRQVSGIGHGATFTLYPERYLWQPVHPQTFFQNKCFALSLSDSAVPAVSN